MSVGVRANTVAGQTKANILTSILYQIVAAVCSLLLPRFILVSFGSDANGVLQSVNQFLSYTVLMECGIGGQIMAAFYKPLAEGDIEAVSDIFHYAKRFFNKISYLYIALVLVFAVSAKAVIRTDFDFGYVSTLVVILGVSYYFTYYLAMTHRLLIRADQKIRIVQLTQSVTLVLNTAVCLFAIKLGCGIHAVKLISAFVLLLNPLIFRLYVKKHYAIGRQVYDQNREYPRKRDAMVHHAAYFIHMNTDIVLISVACGTTEVSVYSVYNSVIYAISNFFGAISDSVSAAIGNILAKGEHNALKESFEAYRFVNTALATFVCTAEAILILPFAKMYTSGVTDAVYVRPIFAYFMIAAQWFSCMRTPFNSLINAAGHYRQTKSGAYLEVLLNVGLSVLLLPGFGIVGVAFGTLAAMAARSVYMAWYLSKNLLMRSLAGYVREVILNLLFGVLVTAFFTKSFVISSDSFVSWAFCAVLVSIALAIAVVLFNLLIHGSLMASWWNKLKRKSTK